MKTPPVYRFLMVCRAGPVLRTFSSPSAFDGYVKGFRSACGFSSVAFQSPVLAVGVVA
jgi:hypothetical protein